jgi:RNA polymerase sigma factor (sigma-70 family)
LKLITPTTLTPHEEEAHLRQLAGLINEAVRVYRRKLPEGISTEELRGEVQLAVLQAVRTWRPDGGASLEVWCRLLIKRHLQHSGRKFICSVYRGWGVARLAAGDLPVTLSLDSPHAPGVDGDERTVDDFIPVVEDVATVVLAKVEAERILALVHRLPVQQRSAVVLRFGFDGAGMRTQAEVAALMGVSQMEVSRRLRRALQDLRSSLE